MDLSNYPDDETVVHNNPGNSSLNDNDTIPRQLSDVRVRLALSSSDSNTYEPVPVAVDGRSMHVEQCHPDAGTSTLCSYPNNETSTPSSVDLVERHTHNRQQLRRSRKLRDRQKFMPWIYLRIWWF